MHPSYAEGFEWDDGNIEELYRHRITPEEVMQIFENRPTWAANKNSGSADSKMVGRTNGGRRLTIVVQALSKDLTLRAITGWDSTQGEITRYTER